MLRGTTAVAPPDVSRSPDRGRAETCDGIVDRALDAPPVLVVVPEAEAAAAGRPQLLSAHSDQTHGIPSIDLVEERLGGLSDALAHRGGFRERLRTADGAEVVEPDLDGDRRRLPFRLPQARCDAVGEAQELGSQEGPV